MVLQPFAEEDRESPFVKAAIHHLHDEGVLEFDEGQTAAVSTTEMGAYVLCWAWVSNEQAGVDAAVQAAAGATQG